VATSAQLRVLWCPRRGPRPRPLPADPPVRRGIKRSPAPDAAGRRCSKQCDERCDPHLNDTIFIELIRAARSVSAENGGFLLSNR